MSIELPEARILAEQMQKELPGKKIESVDTKDLERMSKWFRGKGYLLEFDKLVGRTIENVGARGNTIHVKLSGGFNVIHGPEYGGRVRLVQPGGKVPKYHLMLVFIDGTKLSMRNTGMGVLTAFSDEHLRDSYMYRRDFLEGISPTDPAFTWDRFKELVGAEERQLKPLLVGKNSYFTGLSNAIFQDVLFRAKVHPKTKASALTETQLRAVYDSIKLVIEERLRLGGKERFEDLYGVQGRYIAAMGPDYKDRECPNCGTPIEKMAYGGGHVYLCSKCQVEYIKTHS